MTKESIRQAVCAGSWYPTKKEEIKPYLDLQAQKTDAISCVCPHAGWMYSGKVAGSVYSKLKITEYETFILVGPNHTGYGHIASVYSEGIWQMSLGKINIDSEVAKSILQYSEFLSSDQQAHLREHCIEVQIPFIQYFNPEAKIVPIILRADEYEIAKDVALAISQSIKSSNKKVMVIASTDMTHYEPYEYAKKQDKFAIDKILELDAEGLLKTVRGRGISMCGVLPTSAVILVSKNLGAKSAELVKYQTSGDITGDYDAVVGYAGLIIR